MNSTQSKKNEDQNEDLSLLIKNDGDGFYLAIEMYSNIENEMEDDFSTSL